MIEEQQELESFEIGRRWGRGEVIAVISFTLVALLLVLIAVFKRGSPEGDLVLLVPVAAFAAAVALLIILSMRHFAAKTLLVGVGAIELRGARGTEFVVPISQIEFIGLGRAMIPRPAGPIVYLRGSDPEGEPFEFQVPSGMVSLPRFLRRLTRALGERVLTGPIARIVAEYPEDEPAWSRHFAAVATSDSARQELLVDQARRKIADSDYAGAVRALKRAARLYSRDAEAMRMLGDALLLTGQWKPASAWYTRSLSLNPGASGSSSGLGTAKYLSGDYKAALRTLSQGFGSWGDGEQTSSLRACCAMMNCDFGAAKRVFEGLTESSKNSAMRKMAACCLKCVKNNEEYTARLQSDDEFRRKEAARGTAGRALKAWAAMIYGALSLLSPIIGRLFKSGKVAVAMGTIALMATALFGALLWRKPSGPTVGLGRDEAAMCWTWLGPNAPLRNVVYKEYFRKPKAAAIPGSRTTFGAAMQGKTE